MYQQTTNQLSLVAQALIEALKAVHNLQRIQHAENKQKSNKKLCSAVRSVVGNRRFSGFYELTFKSIKLNNAQLFFNYTNMNAKLFDNLLCLFELEKMPSANEVTAQCKLAILLMYLTQATSMRTLASLFSLDKETVRLYIKDSASTLIKILQKKYLARPTIKQYEDIAKDYSALYNMPHCIGAIDGKYIALLCTKTLHSNISSILLLAACDAKYRFTSVEIDAYDSPNEQGIFQRSKFGTMLLSHRLEIPASKCLPGTEHVLPHYFAVNSAIPMALNLMRPFAVKMNAKKREFNEALKRAHGTIDNAMGILFTRWKILQTKLNMSAVNAEQIVLLCVLLHNFIMLNDVENPTYCPYNYADWFDSKGVQQPGIWRSLLDKELPQIRRTHVQNHYGGKNSTAIRNNLCDYVFEQRCRMMPSM